MPFLIWETCLTLPVSVSYSDFRNDLSQLLNPWGLAVLVLQRVSAPPARRRSTLIASAFPFAKSTGCYRTGQSDTPVRYDYRDEPRLHRRSRC